MKSAPLDHPPPRPAAPGHRFVALSRDMPAPLFLALGLFAGICGVGHLTRPDAWGFPHVPPGKTHRQVGLKMCAFATVLLLLALLKYLNVWPSS